MGRYAPFVSLIILAVAVYLTVLFKRDKDLGGAIGFKEAFVAGISASFVVGMMVGVYLLIYSQYINPNLVNEMMKEAEDFYKSQPDVSQEQIDRAKDSVKAMYSPFGQLTYGIGTTMLTGALITLVCAFIMQRTKTKAEEINSVKQSEKINWEIILYGALIGFLVFLVRYEFGLQNRIDTLRNQGLSLLIVYFPINRVAKRLRVNMPNGKTIFSKTYLTGILVYIVAAIIGSLLSFLASDNSSNSGSSNLNRSIDVGLSTLIIGGVLLLIISGIVTYRETKTRLPN